MEKILLIFGVTLVVSYVGSINPGPVNLAVIRAVLQRHRLAALGLSIGSSLPEFVSGYIALRGLEFFEERPDVFSSLKLAIAPILLLIGILALRKKTPLSPAKASERGEKSMASGLVRGSLLALLNPALLPFWLIVLVWYANRPALRVETWPEQVGFLIGAALGALAIRTTYVFLAERYCDQLLARLHPRRLDQAFGWCFIGLGSWQAVQWWLETYA